MFSFLKKKRDLPEFDFIKSYSEKEKYFVRTKKWNWLNPEQIALLEKDSDGKIKMTTMDYWHQEMFLDADGQKTISEYLSVLINQFRDSKMEIPSDLDKFMVETLLSLKTDLNAIEFSKKPTEIKTEFRNPIKE
ncbi:MULTISPECIES: hypothetical protein [Winogradskyella]|uniref:hypothetical protein n=1 Tax=Winogradskyella TaxID=286104 RepID=UPI001FB54E11|nr:hypothetical protein [Winogradskyella sp. MH6]|tara:strand:- start:634 stop:1035 length:402 start_codon:yes stop_codon:yes gene_type:complete